MRITAPSDSAVCEQEWKVQQIVCGVVHGVMMCEVLSEV